MNFKRLEIFGFKSFADKVIIDFNDGITGIVGPNGSGKSNFSEAIKWVLGEQRAGELRSKNMQDVIFNGTVKRGSMSYCEVTLVFDNTNKLFSMLEFDEVSITRKLYRSGDSEYLLNKTPCRLKDIRDIITDTGLGKDGYSIIGQGRVEKIITSKPEDRRSIFEEAAGITKYKARKTEAENKLKRTQESLVRLEDIIHEIDRQLAPLSRQADDARQYHEYYEQLKDLEVNHYLCTYEKNKVDKVEIADRLQGIREESAQIVADIKALDDRYSKLFAEQNNTDVLIGNLRGEQTAMMVDEERRLGQNNLFGEKLKNLKQENMRLSDNIKRMQNELDEVNLSLVTCADSAQNLADELLKKRAKYTIQEDEYTSLTDQILAGDAVLEHSSRTILQTLDELADVKIDMSKLGAENELMVEKLAETEYALERIKKQIEIEEGNRQAITSRLNAAKLKRDEVYKARNIARSRVNELKFEQNILNDTTRQLSGSISSLDTKVMLIEKLREQYENYQVPVQRLMQEAKQDRLLSGKILGVVAELIKVPQRLEVAIETALGGAMQNIVTATDDDVKYIIDILKQKRMGRITFLPINTFKSRDLAREHQGALSENGCLGIASKVIGYDAKYSSVFSGLLGSTIVCDTYENAIYIFKKYHSAFRIVTLEGDILSVQGSISGGSRKSEGSNILSQERELEQAKVSCDKCKRELAEKTERLSLSLKESDAETENLKSLDEQFNAKEIEYATETERENKASERLDNFAEEMTNLSIAKEKIGARLEEIGLRLTSSDILEGDIKGKRASVDDIQAKSKKALEVKKSDKDNLSADMTASRVLIAELESKQQNINEELNRYQGDQARLLAAIADDTAMLTATGSLIAQNEERVNKLIAMSESNEKFIEIKEKLHEAEDYKRKISLDILQINADKDDKNFLQNNCSERRVKEEGNTERIDSIMEAMTARLAEEYSLDHDGAVASAKVDFDDYGAVTQIVNLKRSIAKLGAINPGAIEQYDIEFERHTNLCAERDDVIQAKADVEKIICDLSKEMLERFETEFAKISANFEVTFRDIFGGGKGELIIDKDAEDPLCAGVEIYAQPPGKKLGQITLFSGGEKALTAIAILFAILKTKPMPFCVLDEIEAALDESNAKLFAKYLKRFTNDTQFIVITHRKPTMEQADRLYGVTMEEQGISKVVSVELSEAVKTAEAPINSPKIGT